MATATEIRPVWKIVPASPELRNEMFQDAIRSKSIEIHLGRRMQSGLQPLQVAAKTEILRPLDCGLLLSCDKIELTTDAGVFEEGDVGVCAEPTRVTLWGRRPAAEKIGPTLPGESLHAHGLEFRFVDLPFAIEPSQVTTKRNGRVLTMNLPRRLPHRQ
jgi:hypothetical protein